MDFEYFAERIEAPTEDNPYYYGTSNPYVKKGYGLPNCTCYACGRFAELHGGFVKELAYGNAENWYDASSLEKGQEPRLGAVMCWRKGQARNQKDGAGHVAVVERIAADGTITVSQSSYSGTLFKRRSFAKNSYSLGTGFTFQGFLYPKKAFVKPVLSPVVRDKASSQVLINSLSLRFYPDKSDEALAYGTLLPGIYPLYEKAELNDKVFGKINEQGFEAWAQLDDAWAEQYAPEASETEEEKRLRSLLEEIKAIVDKL